MKNSVDLCYSVHQLENGCYRSPLMHVTYGVDWSDWRLYRVTSHSQPSIWWNAGFLTVQVSVFKGSEHNLLRSAGVWWMWVWSGVLDLAVQQFTSNFATVQLNFATTSQEYHRYRCEQFCILTAGGLPHYLFYSFYRVRGKMLTKANIHPTCFSWQEWDVCNKVNYACPSKYCSKEPHTAF